MLERDRNQVAPGPNIEVQINVEGTLSANRRKPFRFRPKVDYIEPKDNATGPSQFYEHLFSDRSRPKHLAVIDDMRL
jgi:hypothetical protein